jgi:hypothetical protein
MVVNKTEQSDQKIPDGAKKLFDFVVLSLIEVHFALGFENASSRLLLRVLGPSSVRIQFRGLEFNYPNDYHT